MSLADKLAVIAENEQKVFDAGARNEWNRFWDNYQQGGDRTGYMFGFTQAWTDQLFRPKYDLNVKDAYYMFAWARITDLAARLEELSIAFDTSKATRFQYLLMQSYITRMPPLDLSGTTSFVQGFYDAPHLIEAILVGGNEITNWGSTFYNCDNLTHLTIDVVIAGAINLSWSPKLTRASLLSVLNALKDFSNSTKRTCTLGPTNLAKLSDADKAIATRKGWTLA